MQYNETAAAELAAKYNLPAATVATWKHRGSIPNKYFKEMPGKAANEAQIKEFDKIVKAFSYGKLNKAEIAKTAGLTSFRIVDLLRKKTKPYENELIAIKKAVNESRNEVKNFLTESAKTKTVTQSAEKRFREILDDKRIVIFKVLDQNREIWAKVDGWKRGARQNFPQEVLEQIKSAFLIFLTETNIS